MSGNNLVYNRSFSPQANIGAIAQGAVRALVFQPRQNAARPGTTELTDFQVSVSDGVALTVTNSGTRVSTTSVNDAPAVGGISSTIIVNDNSTVNPFSTITVADPDTQDLTVAATILNGGVRGDFTSASSTGWTCTISGNNIVYSRYFIQQANIGSAAQTSLRGLTFLPRQNAVVPGTTELTDFQVFVNDGVVPSLSNTGTRVTTNSVNDAPLIGGVGSAVAVNDNATVNLFPSITVTDPNYQGMTTTVTILNGVVRGDFTTASSTGWTRTVSGNNIVYSRYYGSANVGAAAQAALRALVFQPRQNAITPGTTELADIQVIAYDGIANSTSSTRITTTSVNNVPTIAGQSSTVAVNDNAIVNPFSTMTVTDVDTQEMAVYVYINNGVVRGDFPAASAAGWARVVSGNDIRYYRFFTQQANIGTAAQTALRALVFQPRQDAIAPGTNEFTSMDVYVGDGASSYVLATTTVTTLSANNAPALGGALANQQMNDNQTKAVFNTFTVADPDTQAQFVTVTILNGVNRGDFTSSSTTGWTRSVAGADIRYQRYFSPATNSGAAVQAAIRTLTFQPRTNVPVGAKETTVFTVTVADGFASVTNSETAVITTGVAPRAALAAEPAHRTESFRATFAGDVDTVVIPSTPSKMRNGENHDDHAELKPPSPSVKRPASNPLARLLRKSR